MKLNPSQRTLLFLGLVLFTALLPLVGGFHHHHDDSRGQCWYCATASTATVSVAVLLAALPMAVAPLSIPVLSAPCRFIWTVRHRRGPPRLSPM